MTIRMRTALAGLSALALMAAGPAGLSHASSAGHHGGPGTGTTRVLTLDPSTPGNNPEATTIATALPACPKLW